MKKILYKGQVYERCDALLSEADFNDLIVELKNVEKKASKFMADVRKTQSIAPKALAAFKKKDFDKCEDYLSDLLDACNDLQYDQNKIVNHFWWRLKKDLQAIKIYKNMD